MHDEVDPATGRVVRPGIIDRMPDMEGMRRDIFSMGVTNPEHYETMKEVFDRYGIVLDPHGAVGWRTLDIISADAMTARPSSMRPLTPASSRKTWRRL